MGFGRRSGEGAVNGSAAANASQPAMASFASADNAAGDADDKLNSSALAERVVQDITEKADAPDFEGMSRADVSKYSATATENILGRSYFRLNLVQQRDVVSNVVNQLYVAPAHAEPSDSEIDAAELPIAAVWGPRAHPV